MRLPSLDGLHQGVVYEDVLLLSLDEAVALFPDVLEVGEDVEVSPGDDLLQHGVDDDVAAGPANPGTAAVSVSIYLLYNVVT